MALTTAELSRSNDVRPGEILTDKQQRATQFASEAIGEDVAEGQTGRVLDQQIAAIALVNDLTVVTRNTADFRATGVRLLDPFQPER